MSLIFTAEGILNRSKGLTFDDVLLVPAHSEMTSRLDPQLETKVTKNHSLKIPIISANMDTVTDFDMALAMGKMGGMGILHRFMSIEEQALKVKQLKEAGIYPVSAAVGVKEDGVKRSNALVEAGVDIITIDIAHGDSVMLLETLEYLKKTHPHVDIIAGNVATFSGAVNLRNAGADAIKLGVGPGSRCSTRIVTGCGMPQLTALAMAYDAVKKYDIPIIADGGIKNSGDMVKAFATGASTIMSGSLFAGCNESPGKVVDGKKEYRGMASKEAQDTFKGGLKRGTAAEGVSAPVKAVGSVADVVEEMCGGIRSGMTYLNARTIKQIREVACFIEMNASGMVESAPRV